MTLQEYISMYACGKFLCMEESTDIDPMGTHWCLKHRERLRIMKYGEQNGYSAIYDDAGQCLLGSGYESYKQACHKFNDATILRIAEQVKEFVPLWDAA